MKTKAFILAHFILLSIVYQMSAQNIRELTAYSFCNGSGLKSSASDYNLGYSYRETDSTLIISGYLGYENCGIEHIFTAKVDSNKVELTEVIIDTLLTTCTCSKKIKIEIDSFYYNQFTVEFNGDILTDITTKMEKSRFSVYPNPTSGIVKINLSDFSKLSEVEIIDSYGRVVETKQTNEQNYVEFDLSNYMSGLYLIRMKEINVTRFLIRN